MAELFKISEARGEKRVNAVFFHGLGGDAHDTWRAGSNESSFWPAWLAQDIEGVSVYSVGYEAPISRWFGSAMHLTDRATNVLARLLAESALTQGSLVLIGHSLGGLVIKQLLRKAESNARRQENAADFLRRVEKIAFFATPHSGAHLATLSDRLRILFWPSAATACLVRNDPNLRDLNDWYRNWANDRRIAHLILTETKSLRVLGMIVNPDSADSGFAIEEVVPIDADHLTISKPGTKANQIYIMVRSFIERREANSEDLAAVRARLRKLKTLHEERLIDDVAVVDFQRQIIFDQLVRK